ncbi:MAG: hypothetical protein R6X18_05200, partial [Chloroflexota bacterium]
MILQHVQASRHAARSLVGVMILALLALVLAACTGVPPGAAQPVAQAQVPAAITVAPTQAPAVAGGKPTAAPTQGSTATSATSALKIMAAILFTTILALSALYVPQPLLPVLTAEFDVTRETAALLTTIAFIPLCLAPLFYGALLET